MRGSRNGKSTDKRERVSDSSSASVRRKSFKLPASCWELATGSWELFLWRQFDRHRVEGSARGGGPLRPPDKALEPEDEAIHLWRAKRNLHHRPRKDRKAVPRCRAVRLEPGGGWTHGTFRRPQAASARSECRGSDAEPDVLLQPALAGRAADQLLDDPAQPRAVA